MTPTPIVETERLILRGRTEADFPAYAAMWAHPVVAKGTSGSPLSTEDAWVKFVRMEGIWSIKGYGFWMVEEKSSGAVIGEIGLADFKREIASPSLDGKPEFGWVLAPAAHGKGYAKEAVRASLAWGRRKFPDATFSCIINPENQASIRVAEANGFVRAGMAPYKGVEVLVFFREPN